MRELRIVCAVAIAALLQLSSAAAQGTLTVGFESASDLDQFFKVGSVEVVPGGVPGNAVRMADVTAPLSGRGLIYLGQSVNLGSAADEVVTSLMFRYDAVTLVSNGGSVGLRIASLYLLSDPNFNSTTRWLDASYEVAQGTPTGPITHHMSVGSLLGGNGSGQVFPLDPLIDDHWYQLAARFSSPSSSRNGFALSLKDFGVDGVTSPITVFESSAQVSGENGIGLRDASVWGGFAMQQANGRGNERSDNFAITPAVVPEPASLAIAAAMVLIVDPRVRARFGRGGPSR